MSHILGADEVKIYKGESKTFLLSVLDGNNNPVDLAGSEIYFTLRPKLCDDKVVLTKSSLDSAQIEIKSPATDGEAYVHFVPSDTEDLDHGDYVYDVWVKLTNGKQIVIIEPSLFEIKPPITEDLIGNIDGDGETVSFNSIITNADMDIYVRAVDGDDNNPGTITAPVATLAAAVALIPYIIAHPVVIHIGPHTGDGYVMPTVKSRILRANIYIIGDGAGSGDGFTELIASTAALAGSGSNVVKSSGLSVDAYRGKTIEILSGAAIGDRRTIRNNTATDIVPSYSFSAVVSTDDLYRIVEPSIYIALSTSASDYNKAIVTSCGPTGLVYSQYERKVFLVNLRFDSGLFFAIASSCVQLHGIELASSILALTTPESVIKAGIEDFNDSTYGPAVNSPVTDLGIADDQNWLGWGLTAEGYLFTGSPGILDGYLVVNGFINMADGIRTFLRGGNLVGGVRSDPTHVDSWNWFAEILGSTTLLIGGNPCIQVKTGFWYIVRSELSGAGNGIQIEQFAQVSLIDVAGIVSGIGVVTNFRGKCKFENAMQLSGGSGDFSVDGGSTVHDKSELVDGVTFSDTAGGVIFRKD